MNCTMTSKFIKKNLTSPSKKIIKGTINPMTSALTSIATGANINPSDSSSTAENSSIDTKLTSQEEQQSSSSSASAKTHTKKSKKRASKQQQSEIEEAVQEEKDDEPEPDQTDSALLPDIRKNTLHEVAMTAAGLGVLLGFGITGGLFTTIKEPSLYICALSIFHFLEFYITAKYNPRKVHKESFIINNGSAYTLAHTFAILECVVEYRFFPELKKRFFWFKVVGFSLTVIGQIVRTIAMRTAGQSFSHMIVTKREDFHELVTEGIYKNLRHPSYTGFFWWAIGTQMLLLNPISIVGFVFVLWNFFNDRIRYEEKLLIGFFGDDYVNYRARTVTLIPFIA
ncbi:hypothetical protein WICPIJ_002428 [Wickerhamomyces pijperi]|uniref:Protein-S-isoprenylcysteine O-methyltransferase n=1 Tax=Wickerhamomyces pijperi TaxID=599730 RepID=A0A9P8TPU7_WICPI|nr:hypothetical protein WICPIJ_002428 [Wickerhamomyces pijperi]